MGKKRRKKTRRKKRTRRKPRQSSPAAEFNRMMTGMVKVGVVSAMGLATMSIAKSIGS